MFCVLLQYFFPFDCAFLRCSALDFSRPPYFGTLLNISHLNEFSRSNNNYVTDVTGQKKAVESCLFCLLQNKEVDPGSIIYKSLKNSHAINTHKYAIGRFGSCSQFHAFFYQLV